MWRRLARWFQYQPSSEAKEALAFLGADIDAMENLRDDPAEFAKYAKLADEHFGELQRALGVKP